MTDHDYMKLALSLAEATRGQTSPNPSVAAIVVKDGAVVGTGVHMKTGGPHAEVFALDQAGELARGATLYVTLEPCSHHGKTPPCAEKVVASGVSTVVVATRDPNPLVAGQGIALLTHHGIKVIEGIEEHRARMLNAPFFRSVTTNRPYVTLKAGMTLDGKIATSTGESKWITSDAAREDAHTLRHQHDAILVGKHTILHDNPSLTTRRPRGGRNPIRIVLDSELTLPHTYKIFQDGQAPTWVYTTKYANEEKRKELERIGVQVLQLQEETLSIDAVLEDLGKRNIQSVLVEGGGTVLASFVESKAFQQVVLYMAPKLFGGTQTQVMGGAGIASIIDAHQLKFIHVELLGPDIKVVAIPNEEEVT